MKTIEDFNLKGKVVLIRCDFNVPIQNGKILDDTRIKESLKTIQYAIDNKAKVVLLSHLGRIKEDKDLAKNTLKPVADKLSELLNRPVLFSQKTRGPILEEQINNLKEQEILLIENTRYEDIEGQKESTNDKELGKYWASLGDIFINDAFGTIHRSHASNVGIASNLESGIGFLIKKELDALKTLEKPDHPYVVILGGAKVKDKIGVIKNLVVKADKILIGGGMAYTFLKAAGYSIGESLLDSDNLFFCQQMLEKYPTKIILPIDVVVSCNMEESTPSRTVDITSINNDEMGLDIGKETIALYKKHLENAKTIVWNGPLGVYEIDKYSLGTKKILAYITSLKANTILGGGDIVAAANKLGYKNKVTHASTGGGATLEYLEGKRLPGLEVIKERS